MTSQDILSNYIRDQKLDSGQYVAFFNQSYYRAFGFESIKVLFDIDDDNNILYDWDFCEGQEFCYGIKIIPFDDILDFYDSLIISNVRSMSIVNEIIEKERKKQHE